ncbi:MAG: hypothetical protein ACJAS9_002906 [Polaribacter sp.]|jgi:hypothetical protein
MSQFLSNITLYNTASLIALLVLLIPIIIHLINPNKATLIWVASLRLIKTSNVKRVFQIKWLEKLLLLVRLILFTLITILLAKPMVFAKINSIDEEHHFYSNDWLENVSESERMELKDNTKEQDRHFILERLHDNVFSNMEKLFESFNKTHEKQPGRSKNQAGHIADLEQRTIIPELTHLYLTNRSSNYNDPISPIKTKYPVIIHIKELDKKVSKEKILIDIIYKPTLSNEKEILVLALDALKENSEMDFSVKTYEANLEQQIDKANLSFVLADVVTNNSPKEAVFIKSIDDGMVFILSDGATKTWKNSSPTKIISILSNIIQSLNKVAENNRISSSMLVRLFENNDTFDMKEVILSLHSKSLKKYLIFLFCLLLLLERWMVLSGTHSHE